MYHDQAKLAIPQHVSYCQIHRNLSYVEEAWLIASVGMLATFFRIGKGEISIH